MKMKVTEKIDKAALAPQLGIVRPLGIFDQKGHTSL